MSEQADERNKQVLAVLNAAGAKAMTPSEIGQQVNKPWSRYSDGYGKSAAVSAVLKRIGAVKLARGQWRKPEKKTI